MGTDDEPVAMGFGDVKLAGVLGAMLGAQNLLVALLLAFLFGAVGGLIGRALGRGRVVPFGPYLVAGAWAALGGGWWRRWMRRCACPRARACGAGAGRCQREARTPSSDAPHVSLA